jgi:hypothetical protein
MGLTKATLTNVDNNDVVTVLFNPTQYSVAKTIDWGSKPNQGKNVPERQFGGGASQILDMDLFFDVLETPNADVRDYINKLWAFTKIDESRVNSATQKARPPLCLFQWGSTWHFKAVVTSLSVSYTLFREDGTPVRATAKIKLEEAEDVDDQPLTNPTSYAEAGQKRREVRPQDTLATIAYQEYGDPNKWRAIADANRLDDPLALKPGQILAIPSLQ